MDNYREDTSQIIDLNLIYLKYFGYRQDGFFVDVGAYTGMTYSNTYSLALAGWTGLCYEPDPTSYRACVTTYKKYNVKVIKTCIGNKEGFVEFKVCNFLSTFNKYHLNSDYWRDYYIGAQSIVVPITTLDKSLKDNNVKPNFEVLSLDVEGSETDVLECFNINYWKPKMAIVEAQELHPAEELRNQAPFINKYFAEAGYEKIYCDEINNIYVYP